MTIQRLAAIDRELDDLATQIEALRRRRHALMTERDRLVNRHCQDLTRLIGSAPITRKASKR